MNKDAEYAIRDVINTELAYCGSMDDQKQILLDVDKIIQGYKNRLEGIEKAIIRKAESTLENFHLANSDNP